MMAEERTEAATRSVRPRQASATKKSSVIRCAVSSSSFAANPRFTLLIAARANDCSDKHINPEVHRPTPAALTRDWCWGRARFARKAIKLSSSPSSC